MENQHTLKQDGQRRVLTIDEFMDLSIPNRVLRVQVKERDISEFYGTTNCICVNNATIKDRKIGNTIHYPAGTHKFSDNK